MVEKKHSRKRAGTKAVPKSVKSYVQKQFRVKTELKEKKIFTTETAITTLPAGGLNVAIGDVKLGVEYDKRIGRKIKLTGVYFKGILNNNSSLTNYVRCLVVMSKGPATTAINDNIFAGLDQANTNATGAVSLYGQLGLMYAPIAESGYSVVHDKVYKIGSSTGLDGQSTRAVRWFKKLNAIVTFDDQQSAASTSVSDRELSVYWFAAEGPADAAGGSTIELSGMTRMWYTDM